MTVFDVIVVGTGIAGSGLARKLADAGLAVGVLERADHPAGGASGNPRALAQPYPTENGKDPYPVLLRAGWEAFLRRVAPYDTSVFAPTGVVLMPNTERLQRLRAEGFAVSTLAIPESAECLSERAGISLAADGWFLPTSGIVNPAALIRAELNGIPCFYGQEVVEIVPEGNFVRVFTTTTEYSARSVVLANAHDVARLPVASYLPVEPVHGEVLVGGCTLSPRLPICGKGFVLPLSSQECLVGARYRHGFPLEPDPTALQEMAERIGVTIHSVHTLRQSYRCSTHDKCPFAGELLDYADLIAQKESILFKRSGKATPCFFDRLFVSVGYGSRGLLLCSLTAEILTEKIVQGRTHPLASLTHPARLTHRLLHRSS